MQLNVMTHRPTVHDEPFHRQSRQGFTLPHTDLTRHFYPASIRDGGGLGSRNSVGLSVCLSVTRVDCDRLKWCTAGILIPHERAITLLL